MGGFKQLWVNSFLQKNGVDINTKIDTNFYAMGPRIVSQMIKEEEATHIKGQADSSQPKLSRLCIRKLEERKIVSTVFQLDDLDLKHWLPLPASCLPFIPLATQCAWEEAVPQQHLPSFFLTWLQPPLPRSFLHFRPLSSHVQHPCLASRIFQNLLFVTRLMLSPFQTFPRRPSAMPAGTFLTVGSKTPLIETKSWQPGQGQDLAPSRPGVPTCSPAAEKDPSVSQKSKFLEVSSYILLHIPLEVMNNLKFSFPQERNKIEAPLMGFLGPREVLCFLSDRGQRHVVVCEGEIHDYS